VDVEATVVEEAVAVVVLRAGVLRDRLSDQRKKTFST
jgi:hypothetical protein